MECGSERDAAASRGRRANRDLIAFVTRSTRRFAPNLSLREALPLFPALTATQCVLAPLPSGVDPREPDADSLVIEQGNSLGIERYTGIPDRAVTDLLCSVFHRRRDEAARPLAKLAPPASA